MSTVWEIPSVHSPPLLLLSLVPACLESSYGAAADDGCSTRQEMAGEEMESGRRAALQRRTVLVVLSVLVVLTITFELLKIKLEELAEGPMEPLMDSMWKELTIMGFIGLISFLASKSGALRGLSCQLYGDAETVAEDVEAIHMLLFLVMCIFLLLVVLLVVLGKKVQANWARLEADCADKAAVVTRALGPTSKGDRRSRLTCSLTLAGLQATGKIEALEYLLLREMFVHPWEEAAPDLPDDFEFARYLTLCLGEELGEIVDVHWLTWAFLELIFVAIYFGFALSAPLKVVAYLGAGYLACGALLIIRFKLARIRTSLLPPDVLNADVNELAPELGLDRDESGALAEVVRPHGAPRPRRARLQPGYLAAPARAGCMPWLPRLFGVANRHERLFWFGAGGPRFVFGCIQMSLLVVALYVAIFGFYISRVILSLELGGVWKGCLFVVGAVPVVAVVGELLPAIITRHIEVCNVEMLKDKQLMVEVERHMKTVKSLAALRLLNMATFCTQFRNLQSEAGGPLPTAAASVNARPSAGASEDAPLLAPDDERLALMREMFETFDSDSSGEISLTELSALLRSLGFAADDELVTFMGQAVDVDGSGDIDFDEFCLLIEGYHRMQSMSIDESITALFELFDKDSSGSISVAEFSDVLNSISSLFSEHDIKELVVEVDTNADGIIDMNEFAVWVRAHSK
ncbi:calmodulin [Thecamonas trahens ATCC 50062]|uniref:Calmodulin n=1 Tax=Thecamonas trahens ATCC 50062 TaxID=461836 RepID=A0A0L0DU88_THETB|nr:calmodulin [Thecamonas trahens ATCC 50062]KNC55053.1 calmodulin [Thecamonas trahens ATCC 50062]|eukprot:XP_013753357.1 calmodulin [Thecamonas trahens ATCC 50062]